ncbi:MAG: 30S ribosomal protein S18, partial [SAR202 cluster bacterium]|nr:30S ribosomal protein S18 [SAR202 cluster bacterium]
DYKDGPKLRRYLSETARIEPRRKTGTCAAHQRELSMAIKRARQLALLPFVGLMAREPFRDRRGPGGFQGREPAFGGPRPPAPEPVPQPRPEPTQPAAGTAPAQAAG